LDYLCGAVQGLCFWRVLSVQAACLPTLSAFAEILLPMWRKLIPAIFAAHLIALRLK